MDLDNKQKAEVSLLLKKALLEDIGEGDVTTDAIIPETLRIHAQFLAKSKGIIAGLEIARLVFEALDSTCVFTALIPDGTKVTKRTVVATVSGNARSILKGERTALNIMQRMSAVASITNKFVQQARETKAVILDTRKTMPGLRILDKWAVSLGGGQNHRFGLYDMILIKDNHITAAKSISGAIMLVRAKYKTKFPIEVEVRTLTELKEALSANPDRILLDNMTINSIKKAVAMTKGKIPLEVSGNVTLANVRNIAKTGVEYISVGTLTHSAQAMDISLSFV